MSRLELSLRPAQCQGGEFVFIVHVDCKLEEKTICVLLNMALKRHFVRITHYGGFQNYAPVFL